MTTGAIKTIGIDLAADPDKTGFAMLRWKNGRALVEQAMVGVRDEQLALPEGRADDVVKVGIDCPLGWPLAFRSFLDDQAAGLLQRPRQTVRQREELAYRRTDLRIARNWKPLRPLSVSADRIAHVAFRCAALLPTIDPSLDRSGRGRVVEVYPAGSLMQWGLPFRGYKGKSDTALARREQIVEAMETVVHFGFRRAACIANDDVLDAVIAAVSARVAEIGQATLPSQYDLDVARIEGWIVLPTGNLDDLAEVAARLGP